MKIDPPFAPPYKTIVRTDTGAFATETLADGTTRDLGEVAVSDLNALDEPAPSREWASGSTSAPAPAKKAGSPPGNSKVAMFLNVPFADKDQAKSRGARWDATRKKWYAPHGADLNEFKLWWPDEIK